MLRLKNQSKRIVHGSNGKARKGKGSWACLAAFAMNTRRQFSARITAHHFRAFPLLPWTKSASLHGVIDPLGISVTQVRPGHARLPHDPNQSSHAWISVDFHGQSRAVEQHAMVVKKISTQ